MKNFISYFRKILKEEKIPRKIHYCWFGKNNKNELMQRCIQSWHKFMPDYEIMEWNEDSFPINEYYSDYYRYAYKKNEWSKISNLVRLWALYNYGGIYLDTDIEVLKRFDPLLEDDCFLGFQQDDWFWHEDWVNCAVMGSVPKYAFLKRCMDALLNRFSKEKVFYRGPELTTKILRQMGLVEYKIQTIQGVKIYLFEYFYPYPWWGKFKPDCITDNTYCIHHWQLSWVDDKIKSII